MIQVKIYRWEKGRSPHYDQYTADFTLDQRKTVMDLLEHIASHFDPTLAFYSHSVCNHGICGRCAVKVNGKTRLACTTVLDSETVILEPATPNVVRDLVTRDIYKPSSSDV